jgi:hypothetical protein
MKSRRHTIQSNDNWTLYKKTLGMHNLIFIMMKTRKISAAVSHKE